MRSTITAPWVTWTSSQTLSFRCNDGCRHVHFPRNSLEARLYESGENRVWKLVDSRRCSGGGNQPGERTHTSHLARPQCHLSSPQSLDLLSPVRSTGHMQLFTFKLTKIKYGKMVRSLVTLAPFETHNTHLWIVATVSHRQQTVPIAQKVPLDSTMSHCFFTPHWPEKE